MNRKINFKTILLFMLMLLVLVSCGKSGYFGTGNYLNSDSYTGAVKGKYAIVYYKSGESGNIELYFQNNTTNYMKDLTISFSQTSDNKSYELLTYTSLLAPYAIHPIQGSNSNQHTGKAKVTYYFRVMQQSITPPGLNNNQAAADFDASQLFITDEIEMKFK